MYKVTRPKSIRLRPDSYAAARVQESCRPSGAPGTAAATRDWKGGGHASRRQRVYATAAGTGERCCLLRIRRRVDPDVNDVPSNCVALSLLLLLVP